MHTFYEETLADLWHKASQDSLVFASKPEIDQITGLSTKLFDCLLVCDSMQFNLDIGRDLWLTSYRFSRLKNDYLPSPDRVERFLDKCEKIAKRDAKRGVIVQMPTKIHEEQGHGRVRGAGGEFGKNHQWGGCMLGFTFRGGNEKMQPICSLHSRTSAISDIGALDLALCWVLAREIGKRFDSHPDEFGFRWYNDCLQWHAMKGMPYLHANDLIEDVDDEKEFPSPEFPTLRNTRRCLRKVRAALEEGLPLDAEKFGPWKRMRTRWEDYTNGIEPKPSVPIESLNLETTR